MGVVGCFAQGYSRSSLVKWPHTGHLWQGCEMCWRDQPQDSGKRRVKPPEIKGCRKNDHTPSPTKPKAHSMRKVVEKCHLEFGQFRVCTMKPVIFMCVSAGLTCSCSIIEIFHSQNRLECGGLNPPAGSCPISPILPLCLPQNLSSEPTWGLWPPLREGLHENQPA